MSKGYSIRVRICNKDFNMISDEKPEYLKGIAQIVDKSINSILASNPDMTYASAAILSAVKFCDDANKARCEKVELTPEEEDNRLRRQVIEYSKELEKMSAKCRKLEKELKKYKND